MFMDISSEIIHSLLPLFLTTTLGLSVAMVGLIDGVAEASASITKVFSGYLSDRIGRRKPLILIGYGLATLTKPLFAMAGSAQVVMAARFADRIGKGVRGAPRDALVADVTPAAIRGRAFGLRQSLDTIGAFTGPLLAIALMAWFGGDMRAVFWVAVIPAALSLLLILFAVSEAPAVPNHGKAEMPLRLDDFKRLPTAFWRLVGVGALFTLARFSEAFLILKANDAGLPLTLAPLVLVAMNVVYALAAYPFGILSDSMGAKSILTIGLLLLIAADVALALVSGIAGTFAGIVLWGLHMAATQGLFAKLIVDRSPAALRGSAFGLFNLVTGLMLLVASVLAGMIWDASGSGATFLTGAAIALLALLGLWLLVAPED